LHTRGAVGVTAPRMLFLIRRFVSERAGSS
jgi:hypothetical protein